MTATAIATATATATNAATATGASGTAGAAAATVAAGAAAAAAAAGAAAAAVDDTQNLLENRKKSLLSGISSLDSPFQSSKFSTIGVRLALHFHTGFPAKKGKCSSFFLLASVGSFRDVRLFFDDLLFFSSSSSGVRCLPLVMRCWWSLGVH